MNVDRVLFEGTTAVGVVADDGTVYRADEVILSGSTYGSAAILLRSGIGPATDLTLVDASIIPEVPSATTNLTVIMLAERIFQRAYASTPSAVGALQRERAG